MFVYIFENKLNNKKYVGQTTQTIKQRWSKHYRNARNNSQYHFHNAIRLYGKDNFYLYGAVKVGSKQDMDFYEKLFIKSFDCTNSNKGYNNTEGGEGGIPSEETRKKMSLSAKNNRKLRNGYSQETKDKISNSLKGRIPWNKGKSLPEKMKENIRKSQLLLPKEVKEKRVAAQQAAIKNNPEYRKKLSEALKAAWKNPQKRFNMMN